MAPLPLSMRFLLRPAFFVLALASVASTAMAEVCAGCRIESSKTILCDPHTKDQAAVLAAPVSGQPAERIATLQEIARLARAHENAPSPNAARAIAKSLKDPDDDVRAEAVKLLSQGQHRRVSRDALSDSLRQHLKMLREKRKDLRKVDLGKVPLPTEERDAKRHAKFMEGFERIQELLREIVAGLESIPTLVEALARHPCVDTLRDLTGALDYVTREDIFVTPELSVAVLSIDHVDAGGAVIQALAVWEPHVARMDEKPFKEGQEELRKVHDALVQYASAHGITEVPTWSRLVSKDWTSWLARNRAALTKPLPACDSLGPAN
jgi:hypothetical protein